MSYETVIEGLHERFATVSGINVILDYVPTSIQDAPLLYSALDSFQIVRSGQVRAVKYRILHRLCIRWQDNERAEDELLPFVDSIPEAVDDDKTLGGRLTAGYAEITECQAAWATIGTSEYRILDFYSTVIEK